MINKFYISDAKVLDERMGIVEAYVNTMGIRDADGDIIDPPPSTPPSSPTSPSRSWPDTTRASWWGRCYSPSPSRPAPRTSIAYIPGCN